MFDPIQEKAKYWAQVKERESSAVKKARKNAFDRWLKREIKVETVNTYPDYCQHDRFLEEGGDNTIRNSYMVNESTSTL